MYEFAQIIEGDDGLKQLVENEGKKNKPYIEFSNNNWWECLLLKDNGGYIDLQWVLNSYNIYDAIEEVLESIEEIIKKKKRCYKMEERFYRTAKEMFLGNGL